MRRTSWRSPANATPPGTGAAAFQARSGYRPPYWELVRMANQARIDFLGPLPQSGK